MLKVDQSPLSMGDMFQAPPHPHTGTTDAGNTEMRMLVSVLFIKKIFNWTQKEISNKKVVAIMRSQKLGIVYSCDSVSYFWIHVTEPL